MVQMFGWSSAEASRASRSKRFRLASLTVSSAGKTLMTTVRPSLLSTGFVDSSLPARTELLENLVIPQSYQ